VKELDLKAVKELAVEDLDLEVMEELAVEELNFEREGSGARDGRRSAARGTAVDAQGGPAGARARLGRRAIGSSSMAGEEGRWELEHGRGEGPAGARAWPGLAEVDAEAKAGATEVESGGDGRERLAEAEPGRRAMARKLPILVFLSRDPILEDLKLQGVFCKCSFECQVRHPFRAGGSSIISTFSLVTG
jgi:hypothetical protein